VGDGAGEGDPIGVLNEVEIAGLNGAAAIRPGAGGIAGYDGVDEIAAGHAAAKVRLVADNGAIATVSEEPLWAMPPPKSTALPLAVLLAMVLTLTVSVASL
jgi:hypothetical protein